VKITPRDIDSVFGLCTILSKKREGATFVVHVECKGPGGSQMLNDVQLHAARGQDHRLFRSGPDLQGRAS
jgi:hypothetical protein